MSTGESPHSCSGLRLPFAYSIWAGFLDLELSESHAGDASAGYWVADGELQ